MKIKVLTCVLYNLAAIIYFIQDYNTKFWYGFSICTVILSFAWLVYELKKNRYISAIENIYINYTIGALVVRGVYTMMCIYQPRKEWINEYTNIFTLLYAVTFGILVVYTYYLFSKI